MSSLPLAAADAGNLLGVVLHPTFIGGILLVFGVAFDVLGCIGLVRMPDVYNRLQAATKCVTLGTCGILLGAAIALCPLCYGVYTNIMALMGQAGAECPVGGAVAAKALICLFFVLVSSPTAAHAIARASHRSGIGLWEGSVGDEYLEDKSRRRED